MTLVESNQQRDRSCTARNRFRGLRQSLVRADVFIKRYVSEADARRTIKMPSLYSYSTPRLRAVLLNRCYDWCVMDTCYIGVPGARVESQPLVWWKPWISAGAPDLIFLGSAAKVLRERGYMLQLDS